ncbi:unnamed protein product [Oikopleura dioica]|uniref:Sema domain-containing protein n=1 Tax=Oikopleura dioica TaxID=34765 RepID=E4X5H4_OIKDI|nr:unnamed protein product [Oikopleura dioica]
MYRHGDSDILYVGGKNLLKLQYDPASPVHPSIERTLSKELLDHSFKDCLTELDGIPRESRVTSILEVDENLLFCTNYTEYCYLIPSDDFQGKTIWRQHTGMPPDGGKRHILVQELADNSGINHKVLYVAKANEKKDAIKCSERILTTMEIDPLALYPKQTSHSLRSIFKDETALQSQGEFNSLEVIAKNDSAFIATFTFVEPTTKMSWFYYVSKIVTTDSTDQKHPSVTYVIGRTCSADVYLRYVSEIPIQCGDHDDILMADFDETLGLLVLNNKGGLCSWTVEILERTFNKMSKSCWYLYGCEDEVDTFDQCPTEVNKDLAKLRSEPPAGELFVDRIQHYKFMGKAPQAKRCQKNGENSVLTDGIKSEIKNQIKDLNKCPEYHGMYEDDKTMTVFCPFLYRDFPEPKDLKEPDFPQVNKVPYVCVPFVPFQTGNSFLTKSKKLESLPAYELGSKFRENNFQFEDFQALFDRVEDKLAIFILSKKNKEVLLWSFEDSGFATKAQQTANPATLNGFSSSILDFVVKNNNIFALTDKDVTVRKIHNCEQIKTCEDCLNSDFPSCGWCSKRSKGQCTDRATCDAIDPKNWISQSGTCPKLETSNKKFFSANEKSIELKLSVSHDYSNLHLWKCKLSSQETNLTFISDKSGRIICDLPKDKADFIVKPNDKGVIKVESARVLYNHVTIAHTELNFYDCTQVDQNKRCTSCLKHTDWKCYWDRSTSKCSDNASTEETNIERANLCPSISAAETIEKVYAPEVKDIAFKVHNNDGNGVGYCHLSTENSETIRRNATRGSDNQIICKDISMTVVNNVEENVFIKYSSNGYFFDSLDETFFVIKDCGFKNPTCTQCRVRDGCSFIAGTCVRETAGQEESVCDPPKIHMITPSSGLISKNGSVAKTPFIITGEQLFVDADSVEVKIGNYDCDVVKEETYSENPIGSFSEIDINRQRLSQIKCFVSSPISIATDYEITIKRNDGSKTTADQKITITDPSVDKISPEYGIKAGYTEITIHGKFLDSGASRSVKIGAEECSNLVVKPTMISCRTPALNEGYFEEDVSLNMDGRVFVIPKSFNYIGNPVLDIKNEGFVHMCDGERSCRPVDTIPTFLSGGGRIWFTLAGFGLRNIFNNSSSMPIINASGASDKDMQSDCFLGQLPSPPSPSIIDDDGIRAAMPAQETFDFYCELPPTSETRRRRRRSFEQQQLTIRYDGWSDNSLKLDVYAEPKFVLTKDEREFAKRSFENVTICFEDDSEAERKFREHSWMSTKISIPEEGIDNLILNTVSQHETNNEFCSVIEFKLPDNIEEETFNQRLLTLKARFGILEEDFATLRVPPKLSVATMSISIISIFVFILIIVMIVYPLYNKYRATQKKHMSLEKKLHAVEEKVSAVAKRAYFELSMELPEIVEDNAQMPVQDYSRYINNVLFPNPGDETPPRQYPESSLLQLKKLLDNPTFTQKALRAIETQPKCTSRDKAKIAAYIMSIFADNPRFITKLTFDLVDSYLKDSVGRTPKLAFRFSNAVVERLLGHWMHLTLYDFLNSDTGKSLWVLLRAIKQQGWKGPVDAVKGHAQFTLTENRLLKEDIEFTPMKLSVIPPEVREDTTEPSYVFVQILDCDTITQVKEKCMDAVYSNIPYSKWPRYDTG